MFAGATSLSAEVNVMENGALLPNEGKDNNERAWTGLNGDGSANNNDCGGWLDASAQGHIGRPQRNDDNWINGRVFLK
jgi:hypothetical protein